ncbi:MAG: hypothetical protein J6Z43_04420 [Clostridiales bacterium]|nr:hypothetical protein [Clostridiales bacterium]
MRRVISKIKNRISEILRDNEGASLVLVSIISIIIVTSVIILRMTVSSLWASADRQYIQDQVYVASTTMGDAINGLVLTKELNLGELAQNKTVTETTYDNMRVSAMVEEVGTSTYKVSVTASLADAEYVYSAVYYGSDTNYTRIG